MSWERPRRHRRRLTTTAVGLAALCVAALFGGCGSRLSEHTLADAAHRPIVRGGSSAAEAAGSQSTGVGAASTPSTAPVTSPGSAAGTASGTAGGASGATPGAAKASSGAAPSHAGSAGSTINLGNVGTYSGVIGAVFSGAQQTLQVWQAYTNAHGGLNGHPIHLFIEDDGADPSTSATDVQQEVTQDHVIAFVGNLVPLTVNASVSYLQQQNIPVIGGDASSTTWWQSPVLFPQAGSALLPHEANFTIKQAVAKGDTKMGLLYCVEDTTCTAAYQSLIQQGAAKQDDGVDPVYTSSFSITQPDFTAQCINAKQAGANFIYFAGDGDSLIRMANDCAAQGYDPQYVGDSIAITSEVATDPHLYGLIAGQSNFPWIDSFTPAQAAYQQAVKTYAPSLKGSATTAAEWAAGELAVAAASALTATPTSAQFFQGLWAIKNNTLGGLSPPLTFNANAPATPSNCYFLMDLQNGQFVDVQNGGTQCVS